MDAATIAPTVYYSAKCTCTGDLQIPCFGQQRVAIVKYRGKIKDSVSVADFKAMENTLGLYKSLGNI